MCLVHHHCHGLCHYPHSSFQLEAVEGTYPGTCVATYSMCHSDILCVYGNRWLHKIQGGSSKGICYGRRVHGADRFCKNGYAKMVY